MNRYINPESDLGNGRSNEVVFLRSWNPSVGAGLAYFATVFAIGFALGVIRVAFLGPLLGDLTAVIIELPIILSLAWLVCRKLVSSWGVPVRLGSRAIMGGLALLLLLAAELALSTVVFGSSIVDHLHSYYNLPHAFGLAGQVAFGLFPLIQIGLSDKPDAAGPSALDAFIMHPDVQERFSITVRAPARIVYQVASEFDMQSILPVRTIFWMRAKLLGSTLQVRPAQGLIADMRSLGWGCLMEREGEIFAAGAVCQPWQADVIFTSIPGDRFSSFSEPLMIKIAWTIETTEESPGKTRLTTETRAVATDAPARNRFRRYWRWARFGIIPIRWMLLPAIRRESERAWRIESERPTVAKDMDQVNVSQGEPPG